MSSSKTSLRVIFAAQTVGILEQTESDQIVFTYSNEWLNSKHSWPISQSIPLQKGTITSEQVHRFFSNLLPEGRIRYLVCKQLGISENNDFELLKAIGGECAGALSIVPDDNYTLELPGNYTEISSEEIEKIIHRGLIYPVFAHKDRIRLSLAGAQDKLPVRIKENQVYLPTGNAASSHILKFPNRDFKHLPENEVLITLIAKQMKLPAVTATLFKINDLNTCLVERFDRWNDTTGNYHRIHQEDLCQALGFSSQRKYEAEGGPSFQTCFKLIDQITANPITDTDTLLRWLIFNLFCGNADAHAKNISLLYRNQGVASLAPLYDLVCTAVYPGIDTRLAMSVGGCFDYGQITIEYWKKLSDEIGIRYSYLRETVKEMAEILPEKVDAAITEFTSQYTAYPVIDMIKIIIIKRIRLVMYHLK